MNRFASLSVCAAAMLLFVPAAHADISFADMFRSVSFTQNGNGNSLTASGAFFSASLTSTNANDYDTVQMTYPGAGSPVNLSQTSPSHFSYQTATYPTQAAMDANFPTGTYQFAASNSSGTDTASFSYDGDHYPQSLPYLTGTDYMDLQGTNAADAFTFHFSPYVMGSQASNSFLFLTIFDTTTNTFVYDAGFQPSTTTQLTVPANTLQANRNYIYELIFSNRDVVPSPGAVFSAQIGFDLRTQGHFMTAVPAPSSAVVMAFGSMMPALALARRRYRRSRHLV